MAQGFSWSSGANGPGRTRSERLALIAPIERRAMPLQFRSKGGRLVGFWGSWANTEHGAARPWRRDELAVPKGCAREAVNAPIERRVIAVARTRTVSAAPNPPAPRSAPEQRVIRLAGRGEPIGCVALYPC